MSSSSTRLRKKSYRSSLMCKEGVIGKRPFGDRTKWKTGSETQQWRSSGSGWHNSDQSSTGWTSPKNSQWGSADQDPEREKAKWGVPPADTQAPSSSFSSGVQQGHDTQGTGQIWAAAAATQKQEDRCSEPANKASGGHQRRGRSSEGGPARTRDGCRHWTRHMVGA